MEILELYHRKNLGGLKGEKKVWVQNFTMMTK